MYRGDTAIVYVHLPIQEQAVFKDNGSAVKE